MTTISIPTFATPSLTTRPIFRWIIPAVFTELSSGSLTLAAGIFEF